MKINNIEFKIENIIYSEDKLLIVFPQEEFTHFFSTIQIDKLVEIEGYEGYTIINLLTINPSDEFILEVATDRNDTEALQILTDEENVTVTKAQAMREQVESMAESLPDEKAEEATWAFPAWNGAGIAYKKNDRVKYNELLYKCIQAHTSQADWTPDTAVSLWVRTSDPAIEWPEWVQPTGAHDAYNKGDKVSHNKKHWISDINGNVWEPGAHGWTEA